MLSKLLQNVSARQPSKQSQNDEIYELGHHAIRMGQIAKPGALPLHTAHNTQQLYIYIYLVKVAASTTFQGWQRLELEEGKKEGNKKGSRKEARKQARNKTNKQRTKSKLESNNVSTFSITRHRIRSKTNHIRFIQASYVSIGLKKNALSVPVPTQV